MVLSFVKYELLKGESLLMILNLEISFSLYIFLLAYHLYRIL